MSSKKTVYYNSNKKEMNIAVDEDNIIKEENGATSFILKDSQLKEFMVANAAINNSAIKENLPPRNIVVPDPSDMGKLFNHDQAGVFDNYSYNWLNAFSNYGFGNMSPYGDKKEIFLAMELFKRDSITRRIVELMVQFSLGNISLEGSTESIRKWYKEWMRQVKIKKVLGHFFLEYYRSSNVTVIKQMLPYKESKTFNSLGFKSLASKNIDLINNIKEAENITYEKASVIQLSKHRKKIPYRYTVVDPRLVDIKVPNGLEFGQVTYTPDHSMISAISDKVMSKSNSLKGLDSEFVKELKKIKGRVSGIVLKPSFASQFFRMKQQYEKYGSPLCSAAVSHLQMKNKLRDMDLSIVDSVKNKILKVTIGDKDFPAKPKAMKTMSDTLQRKGKVFTLLWNHTLKMEWVEPKYTELNHEKYKNVDKDIREAFGITPVLLGDTEGQNYATAYVSMKGFIENLRDGIDSAIEFLEDEFSQIALAMGFSSCPRPKIKTTNLTDTINMIKIQQTAVQNGILSKRTVCEAMGNDWDTEVQRMKTEKKLNEEGIALTSSPNTKSKNEDSKTESQKVDSLNKNQTGKPVLKQGLTDEDTKGSPKTKNMTGEKKVASIDLDSASSLNLVELFKVRHVGKRLYTKLLAKLNDLGADKAYESTIRLMTAIPRSAFSYLDDDLNNLNKESIEDLNKFVDHDRVSFLSNLINGVKKDIGMKHISNSKLGDIVAESWAIYMTTYDKNL